MHSCLQKPFCPVVEELFHPGGRGSAVTQQPQPSRGAAALCFIWHRSLSPLHLLIKRALLCIITTTCWLPPNKRGRPLTLWIRRVMLKLMPWTCSFWRCVFGLLAAGQGQCEEAWETTAGCSYLNNAISVQKAANPSQRGTFINETLPCRAILLHFMDYFPGRLMSPSFYCRTLSL